MRKYSIAAALVLIAINSNLVVIHLEAEEWISALVYLVLMIVLASLLAEEIDSKQNKN